MAWRREMFFMALMEVRLTVAQNVQSATDFRGVLTN
jgi:hypothetical protein